MYLWAEMLREYPDRQSAGTYDQNGPGFKGDVSGSDKSIGFRLPSRPDLDWALVFEAPIDLMSYLTLHRQVTRQRRRPVRPV